MRAVDQGAQRIRVSAPVAAISANGACHSGQRFPGALGMPLMFMPADAREEESADRLWRQGHFR